MNDWVCPSCGFEIRYFGEVHGIYPAVIYRAFNVYLIYYWMHESMRAAISFRSIFELICNLYNASGYRRKFDTGRIDIFAPESKRHRRLGNKALQYFGDNIDLGEDSEFTKQLFSRSKFEVSLNGND